ncbi:hypothetical protein TNCV_4949381 [Trichonephila clavipes]|nr:hypothetical protein TNCV_4949381 [Trichonephila clavipes]
MMAGSVNEGLENIRHCDNCPSALHIARSVCSSSGCFQLGILRTGGEYISDNQQRCAWSCQDSGGYSPDFIVRHTVR